MTRSSNHRLIRARARGFTLVELIVALVAGIAVSLAGFLLARNSSEVFEEEAKIATAQLAAQFAMNRLSSDLQRGGFMGSPNVLNDPLVCRFDTANWPQGMLDLAAVTIEEKGSVAKHPADHTLSTTNNLSPDAITVGAAFSTTELFPTRGYERSGTGWKLTLDPGSAAMVRTLEDAADGGYSLAQLFAVDKIIRIIDPTSGFTYFGIIAAIDPNPALPIITISGTPKVPAKKETIAAGSPVVCGLGDEGGTTPLLVNPVERISYDIRAVNPGTYPSYKGLYTKATHAAAAKHKGKAPPARTELVRVELDKAGKEIVSTLEVVSEFGVDLKFGLTRTTDTTGDTVAGNAPVMTRRNIGAAAVYADANYPGAGGQPEWIRTVQIRLSTRGSVQDRDIGIAAPPSGGVFRFALGTNLGFVRARTLVADVTLQNLAGVNWP